MNRAELLDRCRRALGRARVEAAEVAESEDEQPQSAPIGERWRKPKGKVVGRGPGFVVTNDDDYWDDASDWDEVPPRIGPQF